MIDSGPPEMVLESRFEGTYPTLVGERLVVKLFGYFPGWRESIDAETAANHLIVELRRRRLSSEAVSGSVVSRPLARVGFELVKICVLQACAGGDHWRWYRRVGVGRRAFTWRSRGRCAGISVWCDGWRWPGWATRPRRLHALAAGSVNFRSGAPTAG